MPFSGAVSLTPIQAVAGGEVSIVTLTAADGTNGNKFIAQYNTLLRVKNTDASPVTVTVHTNYAVHGLTLPSDTFVVPANTGDVIYSGFASIFHQNEGGEVWVEFSAVTGVTAQVIQPL